ncbi:hypothetical protein ACXNSR_18615 [Streptomyces sp. NC-S4]
MYLVHVYLAPHPAGTALPMEVAALITGAAARTPEILHVAVHPADGPGPVIGVYLKSAAPELAESAARVAWWSAVDERPWLGEWSLLRASVSLAPDTAR